MVLTDTGPSLPDMFDRYKGLVEAELLRSVPALEEAPIYPLLRYHLGWAERDGSPARSPQSQGKALRPTLCLFACDALRGDLSQALPAAAAIELMHNFSLVHDDIQDKDLERRHQPTVWSLWGVPRALVAGNAMHSVSNLAELGAVSRDVPAATALRVSQLLSESCLEMIQGQCMDMEFETSTSIDAEDYLQMVAFKTGALIRVCLQIGALLATDDPGAFRSFSAFGAGLGRAFQIRDDYLGIWGDEATTGKAAGNDIRRRKKSFPIVYAFARAQGPLRDDLDRIYAREELDDGDVARVLEALEEVGAREQSQALIDASAGDALEALAPAPLPGWARKEAGDLIDFVSRREY